MLLEKLQPDAKNPATGEFDLNRWLRSMNSIPDDVREEMLKGTEKSPALQSIFNQVRSVNASGGIPEADKAIKAAESTVTDILGNKTDLLNMIKNPDKVDQLKQLVGPDGMGELGSMLLKNQLREAASEVSEGTGNVKFHNVDTGKFLQFIQSLKDSPEVIDAFFKPTPEKAEAYAKLLQSVTDVNKAKEMIKLGVLAPVAGYIVGTKLGHPVLSIMLAEMASEGGGWFRTTKKIFDDIANHPATWATLKAVGKTFTSAPAKAAASIAKAAAGKYIAPKVLNGLKGAYDQAAPALGGQSPNGTSSFSNAGASLQPGASASKAAATVGTTITHGIEFADKNIQSLVDKYAKKYSLPTSLARAVIFHESQGNPNAIGKPTKNGKAAGLGQLLPDTAKELGVTDPLDPVQNINASMRYLHRFYKEHGNDPLLAYAAYTSGPNRVPKGSKIEDVIKTLPPEGQKGVKKVAQLLGIDLK